METYQLQIQIGEYLVNLLSQLDQKLNTMNDIINNIDSRLTRLENNQLNYIVLVDLLKKIESYLNQSNNNNNNHSNINNDYDFEIKRKISVVKREKDFQRLLEKEKLLWEKEYKEQEELLIKAKEEWEKEVFEKLSVLKDNTQECSYYS